MTKPNVEEFSSGYYLLDSDVCQYNGEQVVAADDTLTELQEYVEQPLLKIGTNHYWLSSEWGIPANTVAVPDHAEVPDDEAVLMAKDRQTMQMLLAGGVDEE